MSKQQKVMDEFREEYNEVRPHEAIGMQTPNEVHERSNREYSEKKIAYDYNFHHKKMKVTKSGSCRWGAYHWLFISRAAIGRHVAAQEIGDGIWNVYYRNVLLGYFDENLFVRRQQYLTLTKIEV